MHPAIAVRLPEIQALCRLHGVKRLELFGSAMREDFDPARSDADFLLEWDQDHPAALPERWWGLEQGLRLLLARKVDLVTFRSIRNVRLRARIACCPRAVLVA